MRSHLGLDGQDLHCVRLETRRAVSDKDEAGRDLAVNHDRHGIGNRGVGGGALRTRLGGLRQQQLHHARRSRQAAGVRRQNPCRAALHMRPFSGAPI